MTEKSPSTNDVPNTRSAITWKRTTQTDVTAQTTSLAECVTIVAKDPGVTRSCLLLVQVTTLCYMTKTSMMA